MNQSHDIEFIIIKNRLEVIFPYNPKIVVIMRRFRGQFIPGPPPRWRFPTTIQNALASELRLNGFTVDDSHFILAHCIKEESKCPNKE